MFTNTIENEALADFENASNAASDLAERIGRCGRAGASKTEMIALLKAWQFARNEARSSHERLLTKERASFRA
jgi:hypothetical protein